jgi:hypothetical protein
MSKHKFTVRLDKEIDKELIRIIEESESYQKFCYDILTRFVNGDFNELDTEEQLKRKKMLVDIEFKEVMIKIKNKELLYRNTFNSKPSFQAVRAIHKSEKEIPQSVSSFDEKNNRFMCPECGSCFVFGVDQKDIGEAKENFIDHYYQNHGEIPKNLEHELRALT